MAAITSTSSDQTETFVMTPASTAQPENKKLMDTLGRVAEWVATYDYPTIDLPPIPSYEFFTDIGQKLTESDVGGYFIRSCPYKGDYSHMPVRFTLDSIENFKLKLIELTPEHFTVQRLFSVFTMEQKYNDGNWITPERLITHIKK